MGALPNIGAPPLGCAPETVDARLPAVHSSLVLSDVGEPPRRRPLAAPAEAALRALGGVLLDEVDGLTDRLTLQVLRCEPCYVELDLLDELREACRANLQRGVEVLADQVPDGIDPGDSTRATGRRRARQGVPLEVVLRAYRLGGRLLWEALLETSRRRFDSAYDLALLDAASYVWHTHDGSCSALVEAYRQEELRVRSHDLSRRHAVLDALLAGRGRDPVVARDAAGVLGLPDAEPLVVVVGCLDRAGSDPLQEPQRALAAHSVASSWVLRERELVGLVALGTWAPGRVAEVSELLRPCVTGRVGMSPPVDGPAGVAAGYRLARTAARTVAGSGMVALDERLPEALLADSPELVDRLTRTSLGGLLDLPEPDRETLISTLDTLLACGGSPTHAARALFCHRNTVIYRMRRIEAVTGRSVGDARDRLLLTLGVLAVQSRRLDRP
ncbi:PucR C-terminal helix-turn-helix domain-containing protein [Pseudonocardia ammonioxydans]|uniref:PucR C-terminal helix-turn-helix domain-containing protein n=1 Tax=Pseudonocardia ammonioxydans TaxID=260086 RepID=A0A1I5GRX9_PSUAM|nr:PucR family transcriptional regulator [Pseudonocardia ammonioxydans]SFO38758.1 PucR C-terminal helix-turn-helix domain-containing protein [Pseudonocardia ammonioxydans]